MPILAIYITVHTDIIGYSRFERTNGPLQLMLDHPISLCQLVPITDPAQYNDAWKILHCDDSTSTYVEMKIVDCTSDDRIAEVHFKIKKSIKLGKLMKAASQRQGKDQ